MVKFLPFSVRYALMQTKQLSIEIRMIGCSWTRWQQRVQMRLKVNNNWNPLPWWVTTSPQTRKKLKKETACTYGDGWSLIISKPLKLHVCVCVCMSAGVHLCTYTSIYMYLRIQILYIRIMTKKYKQKIHSETNVYCGRQTIGQRLSHAVSYRKF